MRWTADRWSGSIGCGLRSRDTSRDPSRRNRHDQFLCLRDYPRRKKSAKYFNRTHAQVSLVRNSVEENVRIAEFIASKLNKARGEVEIIVPLKGFSAYDRQGQPFFDLEADAAFLDTLRKRYQRPSHIHEIDAHINDPVVAGLSAKTLLALMNQECGSL